MRGRSRLPSRQELLASCARVNSRHRIRGGRGRSAASSRAPARTVSRGQRDPCQYETPQDARARALPRSYRRGYRKEKLDISVFPPGKTTNPPKLLHRSHRFQRRAVGALNALPSGRRPRHPAQHLVDRARSEPVSTSNWWATMDSLTQAKEPVADQKSGLVARGIGNRPWLK